MSVETGFRVGDRCVTQNTRLLGDGLSVELIYECPSLADGDLKKWKVRVDGRTGLDAYWYVREDCLRKETP